MILYLHQSNGGCAAPCVLHDLATWWQYNMDMVTAPQSATVNNN